jgi:hypothetical protein
VSVSEGDEITLKALENSPKDCDLEFKAKLENVLDLDLDLGISSVAILSEVHAI